MVASYDLQPGNGAGPIFWKVRDRRRDRREGKTHKKVEGKIQIGKVSKTNNTYNPHAHIYSTKINK